MTDEKKPFSTDADAPPSAPKSGDGLASIWQSALGQIDEIRDVIVRGSHAGKAKIDVQLLKRTREKVLVQIAEALLEDVKTGAATMPASADALKTRIDELDAQIASAEEEANKAFRR